MKKLFTTLALAGVAFAAKAQDTAFVQPFIFSAPATINCTDSFEFGWAFINHGPASIKPTDTFGFNDYEASESTSGWIGWVDEEVMPGDTFFVNLWNSHYNRIGWAVDPSAGAIVNAPLPNGTYGFAVQFFGFYTNSPAMGGWIPRTDLVSDDPNPDDDVFSYDLVGVEVNCTTGGILDNSLATSNIQVYPNPTNNQISFNYNVAKAGNVIAKVTDLTGRVVLTKDFGTVASGDQIFTISVADLANGNYALEVITSENRGVSKFTVAK